jgi:hypothetical protein
MGPSSGKEQQCGSDAKLSRHRYMLDVELLVHHNKFCMLAWYAQLVVYFVDGSI